MAASVFGVGSSLERLRGNPGKTSGLSWAAWDLSGLSWAAGDPQIPTYLFTAWTPGGPDTSDRLFIPSPVLTALGLVEGPRRRKTAKDRRDFFATRGGLGLGVQSRPPDLFWVR